MATCHYPSAHYIIGGCSAPPLVKLPPIQIRLTILRRRPLRPPDTVPGCGVLMPHAACNDAPRAEASKDPCPTSDERRSVQDPTLFRRRRPIPYVLALPAVGGGRCRLPGPNRQGMEVLRGVRCAWWGLPARCSRATCQAVQTACGYVAWGSCGSHWRSAGGPRAGGGCGVGGGTSKVVPGKQGEGQAGRCVVTIVSHRVEWEALNLAWASPLHGVTAK